MQQKMTAMEDRINELEASEMRHRDCNQDLSTQLKELNQQLEQGIEARTDLKKELTAANEKIISIEEEVFEAKSIQNELLDQLKIVED